VSNLLRLHVESMKFNYPDWSMVHRSEWEKLLHKRLASFEAFTAIEVGCFEGRSTVWFADFLKNNSDSELICIDTWEGGEEIVRTNQKFNMEVVKENFSNNVDQHPYKDQIRVFGGTSEVHLSNLLSAYYQTVDFIYLDGSHTQRDTLVDLTLSLLLIKKDGIIVVDDYANNMGTKSLKLRPKKAVDFVVTSFGSEVEFSLTPERQAVIIRK
jgi:predicted O-methyltransferase YrrM